MAEQQQTKKVVLIVVLGVVLAAVLVVRSGLLLFGSRKGAGPATATQKGKGDKSPTLGTKGAQATPLSVQTHWKKPEPVGPVVNDPMRLELPPDATQKTQTAEKPPEERLYRIAGIVYSTEQPSSVIIDGHILHEGDTIYEATVVKIAQNEVILRRGDKIWTIKAGQTNKEPE